MIGLFLSVLVATIQIIGLIHIKIERLSLQSRNPNGFTCCHQPAAGSILKRLALISSICWPWTSSLSCFLFSAISTCFHPFAGIPHIFGDRKGQGSLGKELVSKFLQPIHWSALTITFPWFIMDFKNQHLFPNQNGDFGGTLGSFPDQEEAADPCRPRRRARPHR